VATPDGVMLFTLLQASLGLEFDLPHEGVSGRG